MKRKQKTNKKIKPNKGIIPATEQRKKKKKEKEGRKCKRKRQNKIRRKYLKAK